MAVNARIVNIGNGSINTKVLFFPRTANVGSEFNSNGQFAIGSMGTAGTTNGRIWIYASNTIFRWNSVGNSADYSEYIAQTEPSGPGDVMVVDSTATQSVRRYHGPYEDNILGVITTTGLGYNNDSDAPDHHNDNPAWANVGMLGQVSIKVSSENGSIQPGDRLTSSSQPGVAMKATRAGQIVGRALDSWSNTDPTQVGMIKALISPSYYDPAEATASDSDLQTLRLEAANSTPYVAQIPFAKAGAAEAASNFGKYSIQGIVSSAVKAMGEFTNLVAANFKAGVVQTNEVTTNTLTANHGAFGDIAGSQAVVDSLSVGTITPDASGAVHVHSGADGKVSILDSNQNEVFSVDAAGNGYFARNDYGG